MSKTKEDMIEEMESKIPDVSINLYNIESGEEGHGGMALHIDFGEKGPPRSREEMSTVQLVAILLSQEFSNIMRAMDGKDMDEEATENMSEVLSSLVSDSSESLPQSKEKDEIDKQLDEMGIKPVVNKEVH